MNSTLKKLNGADQSAALAIVAPLVERSPWVAEAALEARPFASDEALGEALVEVILSADATRRRTLFQAHPPLAGSEAMAGRMTDESTDEQGRLGLTRLTGPEARRLQDLNAAYEARFGFPFIVALHRVPDRAALFDIFERRLTASPLEEHTTTLAEIASVIRARAARAFGNAPSPHLRIETEIKE